MLSGLRRITQIKSPAARYFRMSDNPNLHKDDVTGEMISKTELKRRIKVREAEAKKASKPKPVVSEKKEKEEEAELSPNVGILTTYELPT